MKLIGLLFTVFTALLLSLDGIASTNVVIFCDVDGVLNSKESGTMFPDDPSQYALNEENVVCLTNLCEQLGAKVVIHSGWNKRAMDATWNYRGRTYKSLLPEVMARLGDLCLGMTVHTTDSYKAQEIINWVNDKGEVKGLVLDDDMAERNHWELLEGWPNLTFFKIDPKIGLSTNNVANIVGRRW